MAGDRGTVSPTSLTHATGLGLETYRHYRYTPPSSNRERIASARDSQVHLAIAIICTVSDADGKFDIHLNHCPNSMAIDLNNVII